MFQHMSAGCLHKLCSFSIEKRYLLVLLGTNCLLLEDLIVELSLPEFYVEETSTLTSQWQNTLL